MSRPWMPLYIADYLKDTAHLSPAEHGAYLLLIMFYWTKGGLPKEEDAIRRITRMTPRQWSQSRDVLRSLFLPEWRHKRCDEEIAKAIEKSKTNSANARSRHSERTANAERTHTQSPSQSQEVVDGGDTREPLISSEAMEIADELAPIAGHDPQFVPPSWCGAAGRVEMWIANGWRRPLILETARAVMAKKRDGPPGSVQYFEKAIAKAHAQTAKPLPKVNVIPGETIDVRAGQGPQANRSASAAARDLADRLVDRIAEWDATGGCGAVGGNVVGMLPAGRRG